MITSTDYAGRACTLTRNGQPITAGDTLDNFRGEPARITGGQAPHKPGSTGKVYTSAGHFYPSVFSCSWTPTTQGA